jgi:lantibiotic biosynthesis protein
MNVMIGNEIKEEVKIKLEQIAGIFYNEYNQQNIGLLTGNSGIAVFLAYYSKLYKDEKYFSKIPDLINENLKILNNGFNLHTFCSGISGFLWSLTHLVKINIIDKDDIADLLNELDLYIYKCMLENIDAEKFDFLHESIGNGLYFIERIEDNPMTKKYLEDLIDGLENHCHKEDDGGLKWLSYHYLTNKSIYNLSLSHGIASIIAFLGKAYKKDVHKEKVKYLLEGSIKFLLKQMQDPFINGSYFPSWIGENEPKDKSRLGWCYGDLGISIVLFKTGEILKDDSLKNKSIEIMTFNSNRRNLEFEGVADAGICHGTSGIAHIFNRMYQYTGIEKFKETSDFWFNETLKMAKFQDGLAGYKAWHSLQDGGWAKEYGLLEGIAGIGITFISAMSDVEINWDECLLLS